MREAAGATPDQAHSLVQQKEMAVLAMTEGETRAELADEQAAEEMFDPDRRFRLTVSYPDSSDDGTQVVTFPSTLTKAVAEKVNGQLEASGERPLFIHWSDVPLRRRSEEDRRHRRLGWHVLRFHHSTEDVR